MVRQLIYANAVIKVSTLGIIIKLILDTKILKIVGA